NRALRRHSELCPESNPGRKTLNGEPSPCLLRGSVIRAAAQSTDRLHESATDAHDVFRANMWRQAGRIDFFVACIMTHNLCKRAPRTGSWRRAQDGLDPARTALAE